MITKLIPMKAIIVIGMSLVLLAVGAFGGYTFCKRSQYKGVIKQQQKDAKAVLKHQEKKDAAAKEIIKYIEVIKKIPDTSGCLDKPSGDEYLNQLLDSDSKAQSSFN
jgi:hypothetical protein